MNSSETLISVLGMKEKKKKEKRKDQMTQNFTAQNEVFCSDSIKILAMQPDTE